MSIGGPVGGRPAVGGQQMGETSSQKSQEKPGDGEKSYVSGHSGGDIESVSLPERKTELHMMKKEVEAKFINIMRAHPLFPESRYTTEKVDDALRAIVKNSDNIIKEYQKNGNAALANHAEAASLLNQKVEMFVKATAGLKNLDQHVDLVDSWQESSKSQYESVFGAVKDRSVSFENLKKADTQLSEAGVIGSVKVTTSSEEPNISALSAQPDETAYSWLID